MKRTLSCGRPKAKELDDPKKLALAQKLYDDPTTDIATICRTLGVSRSTLYRYITPHPRVKDTKVS